MNKYIQVFLGYVALFVNNKRGMMFDLMRIIFMLISIVLGNFVGAYISSFVGIGGALIGALIIGIVIYYVYSMLAGQQTNILGAIVFGILNYVSTIITGYVGTMTNLSTGIVAIIIQALVLSMLWGYLGGKAQPKGSVKTGLKP